MGNPRITYNGKTIDFPAATMNVKPFEKEIQPAPPRTVNRTLTGDTETVLLPRVDNRIHFAWRIGTDQTVRVQLENLRQWALQGNAFRVVMDSAKTVKTTLVGVFSAGSASVKVANPSGITSASRYVLRGIGSPNYQLIIVGSVTASTVNLQSPTTLDFSFASGDVFRDEYLWDGILDKAGNIEVDFRREKPDGWSASIDFVEDPTT